VSDAPAVSFILPVPGPAEVLTPFRPPATRYGAGHRGVDLAAPAGIPVRAAADGTVVYAGDLAGRGVVSVQHPDGLRTTYEPVTATVTRGQSVTRGAVIGTLQEGHPSCAPAVCLHWGARLADGSYLDPMALLRPWRVRLKPWDAD
jgi:murein DD-endopeptidase MepM/ murein hydrolase activator NlpD